MLPQLPDSGLPNSFLDILSLAGIVVFAVTSISAVLSSLFVRRDNLFYLGTQLILLFLVLEYSAAWSYPLWFAGIFATPQGFLRIVESLLLLAIAYTVDTGMRIIVWDGILGRHGKHSVPPLLVGAVRMLIYLFAALTILQFVYNKSITALAALSGAFALVVGLSAQSTLGEMFAGIAIALSRPFRIGDWVKIGNLDEGRVLDMSWRMIRIETRDKIVLNVPNRAAADQPVRNFSYPNRAVRISETIHFPQGDAPGIVQDVLAAAIAAADGILADPRPTVLYRGAKDGVCEYSMRYYIDDYQHKDTATESVWKNVLDQIAGSKLKIAFPRRHIDVESVSLPAPLQ